jgi:hypothetical protein
VLKESVLTEFLTGVETDGSLENLKLICFSTVKYNGFQQTQRTKRLVNLFTYPRFLLDWG